MNVFAAAATKPLPLPTAPEGFDLNVTLLGESRTAAITLAVHEGQLDGFICQGQLWVRCADIHELLPSGHCTDDELDTCCFIPPQLIETGPLLTISASTA